MAKGVLSGSARRYADAAFAVALESAAFDEWMRALAGVAALMERPDVRLALTSPAVSPAEKRATLDRLVVDVPPVVRNFLHILVERDRIGQIEQIAAGFRERVNRERGVLTADVTTAMAIDADLERTIAERLGAYLQHDPRRLVIRSHVDADVIGGVVAKVGDTLIDDSVRGRLMRLRRALGG